MKDHWVTCDEYTAGPYDAEQAERMAAQIVQYAAHDLPHACRLEHQVVVSDIEPVPPWKQAPEGGH